MEVYEYLIKSNLKNPSAFNKQKVIRQNTYYNLIIMKKRLEADLISIAHRILQIKDKSDVNQLYLETQKLYEKLSVLKFVEENYSDVRPTIGNYSEIEKEIENFYDEEALLPVETEIEMNESNMFQDVETDEPIAEKEETEAEAIVESETSIEEETTDEEIVADENDDDELVSVEETETEDNNIEFHESEPEIEEDEEEEKAEVKEDEEFKAAFELTEEAEDEEKEEKQEEEVKKTETVQISFEDLLGLSYSEPEFVKVDDVPAPAKEIVFEPIKPAETPVQKAVETAEKATPKKVSLNDKLSKGIEIDLNDRIAFVKHLFGNSNEDYNRVMNQLITYDNFFETKSFIDEMVKPDYNNWEGKEEYEERFMEIIEKKFL